MQKQYLSKVNEFMFNKKEAIVVQPSNESGYTTQLEHAQTIVALMKNLEDLGYRLDSIEPLFRMSKEDLNTYVYQPLLKSAKESKGAHVEHRLLFKNFPDDVKKLDIEVLSDIRFAAYFTAFIDNAILGQDALSDGSITRTFVDDMIKIACDVAEKEADVESRSGSLDNFISDEEFFNHAINLLKNAQEEAKNDAKVEETVRKIQVVSEDAYFTMVQNMLSAKTSLSVYDQTIVKYTIDNFDKELYMPDKIQFKETQALLDKYNFDKRYLHNIDIKTANDFERLLASLSNGDVSLSKRQKYRSFKNQERKALYAILMNGIEKNRPIMLESFANGTASDFTDQIIKKHLHLNDDDYDKDGKLSKFISEAKEYKTTMARYEHFLKNKEYQKAAIVLVQHSHKLFLQRTRELIGKSYAEYETLKNNSKPFEKKREEVRNIANMIASAGKYVDVYSMMSLNKELQREHLPYKFIFPKGKETKMLVKENKSAVIPDVLKPLIDKNVSKAIEYQMKNTEMIGKININNETKVYIDERLKKCPIPVVGRDDSGKHRTVATGTRFEMEECDILRAALYKQNDRDQFIDFSAAVFDEDYKMITQVSWNNLKARVNGEMIDVGYHSGDTHACSGKGCTEMIDINLSSIQKAYPNAKYVGYMAIMWNSVPLSTCNELFMTLSPTKEFGKVNGEKVTKNNEIFDPKQVQFKLDITGESVTCVPMLYDIQNHEAIITNIGVGGKDWNHVANTKPHFDLPKGCECIENYASSLAMTLFAYENLNKPSIYELAELYVNHKDATVVNDPSLADIIFATDRIDVEDMREILEGVENPKQIVISPFDKDVITAELIPAPLTKDQVKEIDQKLESQELMGLLESSEIGFERE